MFIVFGWGKGRNKNHGSAAIIKCSDCFEKDEWSLIETRNTFNLFFIPILSYDNKYFLVCNKCGRNAFEIYGDQINVAKKMVKVFKLFHNGRLSKDHLDEELRHNPIVAGIESPNDNWECPECSENNPNISYTCRKCGYRIV